MFSFYSLSRMMLAAVYDEMREPSLPEGPGARRLQSETCQNIKFTKYNITTSAIGAVSAVAADMNGDGYVDVVSASYDDNKISVYINHGGSPPTFEKIDITNKAIGAEAVQVADVNGDGHLDIISVDRKGTSRGGVLAWYESDGNEASPGFLRHVVSDKLTGPTSVDAADMDGDGRIDLLVGGTYSAWYKNNKAAEQITFTENVIASGGGAYDAHAKDVNGDGHLDIIFGRDGYLLQVSNGEELPSFSGQEPFGGDFGNFVYAADLDADGRPEIISVERTYRSGVKWYNYVDGNRNFMDDPNEGGYAVHADDVDNDGAVDVLVAFEEKIVFYKSDGKLAPNFFPGFDKIVITSSAKSARSIFTADLDGDGIVEIIVASEGDNTIAYYKLNCVSTEAPTILHIATPLPTTFPPTTPQPSERPTPQPTVRPTPQPTETPEPQPTVRPTPHPTEPQEPSTRPTEHPLSRPTLKPASLPIAEPTSTPSPEPTQQPAGSPSPSPSVKPTSTPTSEPSSKSSPKPSPRPTDYPSATPTATVVEKMESFFQSLPGIVVTVISALCVAGLALKCACSKQTGDNSEHTTSICNIFGQTHVQHHP